MPRFRLRSDSPPVTLFGRSGSPDAFPVEPGQVVDVPGKVEASDAAPPDAYLVVHGDDARLWPKTDWELVEDKPAVKEK